MRTASRHVRLRVASPPYAIDDDSDIAISRARRMKKKAGYEVGSGNVFADIGLPNAGEHLIKAQLV